jgi:hypothetical protein
VIGVQHGGAPNRVEREVAAGVIEHDPSQQQIVMAGRNVDGVAPRPRRGQRDRIAQANGLRAGRIDRIDEGIDGDAAEQHAPFDRLNSRTETPRRAHGSATDCRLTRRRGFKRGRGLTHVSNPCSRAAIKTWKKPGFRPDRLLRHRPS